MDSANETWVGKCPPTSLYLILACPGEGPWRVLRDILENGFLDPAPMRVVYPSETVPAPSIPWPEKFPLLKEGVDDIADFDGKTFWIFSPAEDLQQKMTRLLPFLQKPRSPLARIIQWWDPALSIPPTPEWQNWIHARCHFSDVILIHSLKKDQKKEMKRLAREWSDSWHPALVEDVFGSEHHNPALITEPEARRRCQVLEEIFPVDEEEEDLDEEDPFLKRNVLGHFQITLPPVEERERWLKEVSDKNP